MRGDPVKPQLQALFLHDRLIAAALSTEERQDLAGEIRGRTGLVLMPGSLPAVGAFEQAVSHLLPGIRELSVAVLEETLSAGELVTLTQDFYVRRETEERATFRTRLDSDRETIVTGRFSTSRLIGATGQSETFGHKRFTMVGYTEHVKLEQNPREIGLRPLFIGWRLADSAHGGIPFVEDRREVWPQQLDQFAEIEGKRASKADMKLVSRMPEAAVKEAFADIIGEPFVPKDWPGESSDLFSSRVSIAGAPVNAAFAFKGPGQPGKLHLGAMGATRLSALFRSPLT